MAITTASAIVTAVFNRDVNAALIMVPDIDATEWKSIRGGLMLNYQTNGEAIYEAIIAAMGTGEDYEVVGGYLAAALNYYVAANVFDRISTGVETRGVMEYTSPNAQKAQPDTKDNVKAEYNRNGSILFDKALNWINENMKDDYSDVPTTDIDWVSGVGYDTSSAKRTNVV